MLGQIFKNNTNTTDRLFLDMMACIYKGGEKFSIMSGHKLYGVAKAEEAERKMIEKETKKG